MFGLGILEWRIQCCDITGQNCKLNEKNMNRGDPQKEKILSINPGNSMEVENRFFERKVKISCEE